MAQGQGLLVRPKSEIIGAVREVIATARKMAMRAPPIIKPHLHLGPFAPTITSGDCIQRDPVSGGRKMRGTKKEGSCRRYVKTGRRMKNGSMTNSGTGGQEIEGED